MIVKWLLPSGVQNFTVHVPPEIGGSDILEITYDWPELLLEGKNLYADDLESMNKVANDPEITAMDLELKDGGVQGEIGFSPARKNRH